VKRGVLTRSVTQANLETVQNSSFGQDITGSIFGYGSVTFEIAGGDDLSFRAIEDPRAIRALVDRAASNDDGLGGDSRRESGIPEICRSGSKFVTRSERFAALSESSSSGTARR